MGARGKALPLRDARTLRDETRLGGQGHQPKAHEEQCELHAARVILGRYHAARQRTGLVGTLRRTAQTTFSHSRRKDRSLSEFAMTLTDDKAMAAAATAGDSNIPKNG